jgi:hypothetical protein
MVNIKGWGTVSTLTEKQKLFNEVVKPTLQEGDEESGTADYQVFIDGRDTDYTNTWHFLREFVRFRESRLLATQHLKIIVPIANNMNDDNEKGAMLRGIVGGGAFTSKRDDDGKLKQSLSLENLLQLQRNVELFMDVSSVLGPLGKSGKMISLYRTMSISNPQALKVGQKLADELPSSTTFSPEFAIGWASSETSIILSIQVPQNYPMVIQCYPIAIPTTGEIVKPRNQDQQEATIAPSEFTITAIGTLRGKMLVSVDTKQLPSSRTLALFESAFKENEEKSKTATKMFSRASFAEKFDLKIEGVVTDSIIKDRSGKQWKAVNGWDDFFEVVDLQPL